MSRSKAVGCVKQVITCIALVAVVLFIVGTWRGACTPSGAVIVTPVTPPDPVPVPPPEPRDKFQSFSDPWDATANQIDWQLVDILAELSESVYEAPDQADVVARKMGFDSGESIIQLNQGAWIVRKGDLAVIVFRGTDMNQLADWICDAKFAPTDVFGGKMHLGFRTGWLGLRKDIVESFDRTGWPKHLWITGHSLGGALSVSCAHDLEFKDRQPIAGIVTFGQPSIVNKALAEKWSPTMRTKLLRVVNEEDLVARVPPGYTYFGGVAWFRNGQVWRTKWAPNIFGAAPEPTTGQELADEEPFGPTVMSQQEFEDLQQQLREAKQEAESGRKTYGAPGDFLGDHFMYGYRRQIERQLDPAPPLGAPVPDSLNENRFKAPTATDQ